MSAQVTDAAAALTNCVAPWLIGVRHHSPACAAAMDVLLEQFRPERILLELPVELASWLPWLSHPELEAPVALSCVNADGEQLSFYPFADFSPELAAVRWAQRHDVPVEPFDLPVARRTTGRDAGAGPGPLLRAVLSRTSVTDSEELWDRLVEARASGAAAEAVRRAGLMVGWAMRYDAHHGAGVSVSDLQREAYMRQVIEQRQGERCVAIVGAFHASALLPTPLLYEEPPATELRPVELTTALIPYAFPLLDSRSGYPAGIRDPVLQQAFFRAARGEGNVDEHLARAALEICRELRSTGHVASLPDAQEVVRLARDLTRLRGLPAPGRRELIEALQSALARGELLGQSRVLARAAERVLVGRQRGRLAPNTPRSGLMPHVMQELERLRLPGPERAAAEPKEVRLDPLRSDLDRRRQVAFERMAVAAIPYAQRVESESDETLTTRWRIVWQPSTEAMIELAGTRGVTLAQSAGGALRATEKRLRDDDALVVEARLDGLGRAAACGLVELAEERALALSAPLLEEGRLVDLVRALQLVRRIGGGHVPGIAEAEAAPIRAAFDETAIIGAGVKAVSGLSGSEGPDDVRALLELVQHFTLQDEAHALGDGRLVATLSAMASDGSPLMQGAAAAALVMLRRASGDALGVRIASWIDAAVDRDGRGRLSGRLRGVLLMAAELAEADPDLLAPAIVRVETLDDAEFLRRVAALRSGFEILDAGGRTRLLETLGERFDDDPRGRGPDVELDVDPALLAGFARADVAGKVAVIEASLPLPAAGRVAPGGVDTVDEPAAPSTALNHEIPARDRWRLILGRERQRLSGPSRAVGIALDELYGSDGGGGGGKEATFPTVRDWAAELEALFGSEVREEVLGQAAAGGWAGAMLELNPDKVTPSIELLEQVLSLRGGLAEAQVARLRRLVERIVAELVRALAVRLAPALSGLSTPRPTRRRGGPLDLRRTVEKNLRTATHHEGRTDIIAERLVFRTRARRTLDWRIILVVDVSGSMEASVIYSAMMAAILSGMPALSVDFLAFNTEVIDLTDRVHDPLSLLLDVQIGGGTHIAKALRYARERVTVPSRSIVVVVSDFEEGYPAGPLVAEVRELVASGATVLGLAALDDRGEPRYCRAVAELLVGAGMPIAALTPLELARWIGEQLR